MKSDSLTASEKSNPKTAPYGYCWRDGKLLFDKNESAVRKLMYELFLAHRRKKTVARLLNERGCRTRSGALFSDMAVDRILRDPTARGIYSLNQNGKQKEIQIEPIVSEEVWEEANAILNGSQKFGKKTVQLFAGLIFCECGGKMNVPSSSPKYVCAECRHKIGTTDMEEIFRRQLAEFPLSAFQEPSAGLPEDVPASETLGDLWLEFTGEEKRAIVEQLLKRVVAGKREIRFEFALAAPASLKTAAFGQQQNNPVIGQQNHSTNQGNTIIEEASTFETQLIISSSTEKSNLSAPSLKEPLMNEAAAARFLGISKMTLLRKRKAGEINFFQVGFRVLYSKEKHLVPFLEKCEKESSKA